MPLPPNPAVAERLRADITRTNAEIANVSGYPWRNPKDVLLNAVYSLGIYGRAADRRVDKILDRMQDADEYLRRADEALRDARAEIDRVIAQAGER
jgi:hypothetical protein